MIPTLSAIAKQREIGLENSGVVQPPDADHDTGGIAAAGTVNRRAAFGAEKAGHGIAAVGGVLVARHLAGYREGIFWQHHVGGVTGAAEFLAIGTLAMPGDDRPFTAFVTHRPTLATT